MRNLLQMTLWMLLVLAAGCRKKEEGPTSASGRVVDQATGQGVGGARVRLLRSGGGNNVLTGGGTVPLDTVTADGSGGYALSFQASEGYSYEVQGFAAGYLTGSLDSQPLVRITGGRKNKKDVPLRPEGYLRVRFLAPTPVPSTGVFLTAPVALPLGVRVDALGSSIDTVFIVTGEGGLSNRVAWVIDYPS